jgi:hypothetical protein
MQQLTLHPHRCVVAIVLVVQAVEVATAVVADTIAVDTIVVAPHLPVVDMEEDTPIDLLPLVTRLRTGVIPPLHHDKTMFIPLATEPGERNTFPRGG